MVALSVSLVVFRSDPAVLSRTLDALRTAIAMAVSQNVLSAPVRLTLVDNGALGMDDAVSLATLSEPFSGWEVHVEAGHGNIGYGRGHNRVIVGADSTLHLILNPDVIMAPDALLRALRWLEDHPEVVALAPRILGEDGQQQYLCRQYPSVLDLFVRGFLPLRWRAPFAHRLARYEMRDAINAASGGVCYPPIISGCFMLFRTRALQSIAGFDARYFLYFEDYDLSLRAGRVGAVAYVDAVEIVHFGGGASRKGFAHIKMFAASAWQFFNRFGWKWR